MTSAVENRIKVGVLGVLTSSNKRHTEAGEGLLSRNLVGEGDGVQFAGTDDEGLHVGSLF